MMQQKLSAEPKRPIEPSDCIGVRTLNDNYFYRAIQINPQGTLVAYIVRNPNLARNRNDDELFIRGLSGDANLPAKSILSGGTISQLKWLDNGRDVVLLTNVDGHISVVEIDVTTGKQQVLGARDRDIVEFAADRNGDTVVFAKKETSGSQHGLPIFEQAATGFRIPYQPALVPVPLAQRTLYVTKRTPDGSWTTPKQIEVKWPTTGATMGAFGSGQNLRLSLSPNGKLLLISCLGAPFPETWKRSPLLGPEAIVTVMILTNLATGDTTIPLESNFTGSVPLWSPDSRSFVVEARSPAGSQWERDDIRNGLGVANAHHLFWVDVFTRRVQLVASHVANGVEQPLLWKENGELLVHTSRDAISRFLFQDGAWSEVSSFSIPLPHFYRFATLASDGHYVVGDYQTFTTPPELFLYKIGDPNTKILAKLNPQFEHLSIAPVEEISWVTSTGYRIEGALLVPPDYSQSRKYPLVIQANFNSGWFACDAGESREPSQIPQPIANAGMLYLMRSYPEDWNAKDEMNHWPNGYPGGIGEAAFEMDVWDSAIQMLVHRGIVDKDKIGIIGFSRKGWTTEFMLAHDKTYFRAATVSDNVQYSVGEYDLFHDLRTMSGYDAMYGGPPYGPSLNTWLRYSISFNLDKITTPLLMESMGHGEAYGNVTAPPLQLSSRFEVFVGLNRLNKPVELYYYPHEDHQPEHPQARLASMQRNLDWYRFWLQGYERPALESREQYARWRHFRDEQETHEVETR
jgi:dipeptidyl aminopeptidase/acylaminoacyl peptidase